MAKMFQLEKLNGVGNVQMIEADVPSPGADEVLIKVKRSLISRGSELFRRYGETDVVVQEEGDWDPDNTPLEAAAALPVEDWFFTDAVSTKTVG